MQQQKARVLLQSVLSQVFRSHCLPDTKVQPDSMPRDGRQEALLRDHACQRGYEPYPGKGPHALPI